MNASSALAALEVIIAERLTLRATLTEALTPAAADGHSIAEMVGMLISQRANARAAAEEWQRRAERAEAALARDVMPPAAADGLDHQECIDASFP